MNYYINEAYSVALEKYLEFKNHPDSVEYNSFLVVVIRTLILIYDELDIINPYLQNDKTLFEKNILKYGYSKYNFDMFSNMLDTYLINNRNNIIPNTIFISIEKMLIDMYMCKKLNYNVTTEDENKMKKILYSPSAGNELIISFNYLHSNNEYEVINYFIEKNKSTVKVVMQEPKQVLSPDAYKVIDKNYTDICLLSPEDIAKINEEVYAKLEVNKNAINFEYLFDKALFDFYHKDDKITTGNGYVDIIMIMGIIATLVLLIIVVTILFM